MKRILTLLLCCIVTANLATAQSKVFKEVNDEISSDMEAIIQDGALVGYLAFTQLEKVSEDSFNYKITIMDENLNDLGTVLFRNRQLKLQAVSFEQDVLCLAYLKSNIIGKQFKNKKAFDAVSGSQKNELVVDFLSLDGKVIKSNSIPVDIKVNFYPAFANEKSTVTGTLKKTLQLKNIPQKGFACYYADETANNLVLFGVEGKRLWKKKIPETLGYSLLTTTEDIYLLTKIKDDMLEGGHSIFSYGVQDSAAYIKYPLTDKDGNMLKVVGFGNDAITGKPYVAGAIIHPKKGNRFYKGKGLANGAYMGVYSINFNGRKKEDIKETFTYWSDGSKSPEISTHGKFADNGAFLNFDKVIRDYQGNTYFVGSSLERKPRWVSIGLSVVCLPLIIVSPYIMIASGTQKCRVKDAMIVKLNDKGVLSFDNTIDCNTSKYLRGAFPISYYDSKNFYPVSNSATQSNYIIVDDKKDIVIYNINKKKIARTIPHKEGNTRTSVYPAKEGHIMVSEYNKKEKYTRLSIESL